MKIDTDKVTTCYDTPILGMRSYLQPSISLYNEDCLETMKRIPDGSVDLLLQDTPFGCTQNEWDIKPNFAEMWPEWERIIKDNGAMIFFGTQPFASELILSRAGLFRYDLIWEKDKSTGFLNANKMPLRSHEHILVFYKMLPTYNPQKTYGHKPSNKNGATKKEQTNYGKFDVVISGGSTERQPKSVIYQNVHNSQHDIEHPTQKPVDLMRYLILTYSNKGDTVFDGYSGSGTTAHACLVEGRKFVGSELDKTYYEKSVKRLKCVPTQLF